MAALNPEPADPNDRQSHHLPPKSYADAVEEGTNGHGPIDEDSIKETPPRVHTRQGSEPRVEPRSLGEILTESEERLHHMSTPTKAPRQPVPGKSYADAAVENLDGTSSRNGLDAHGEQYIGEGMAESPRSPTRRPHKRVSSRSMNGIAKEVNDGPQSKLVHEKYESKDGDKLTSVKPPDGYEDELRQDKQEAPPKHKKVPSENLVSGRQAGAGWQNSA